MKFFVHSFCVYTQVSVETKVYTHVFLRKGACISGNMKVQDHTTDQELLGFTGYV
jgi:hypothetical protein